MKYANSHLLTLLLLLIPYAIKSAELNVGKQEADATASEEPFNFQELPGPIQQHIWNYALAGDHGEKHYLLQTAPTPSQSSYTDQNSIWSLAYNPATSEIAVAGRASRYSQEKVSFYGEETLFTAKKPGELTGHTGLIHAVAYRPGSTHIASGSRDGTIRIWDHRAHVHTIQSEGGWVVATLYSPDGNHILSGHQDGCIRIWDANSFELFNTIHAHEDTISSLVFRPGHAECASVANDGTIKHWSVPSGTLLATFENECEGVTVIAYNHDGTLLASGSWDDTIRILNPKDGTIQHSLETEKNHNGSITSLAFNGDSTQLTSGDGNGNFCIWSAKTGGLLGIGSLNKWHGDRKPIMAALYIPNESLLLSADSMIYKFGIGHLSRVQQWIENGYKTIGNTFVFPDTQTTKPVDQTKLHALIAGLVNMKKKNHFVAETPQDKAYLRALPPFVKDVLKNRLLPPAPIEKPRSAARPRKKSKRQPSASSASASASITDAQDAPELTELQGQLDSLHAMQEMNGLGKTQRRELRKQIEELEDILKALQSGS